MPSVNITISLVIFQENAEELCGIMTSSPTDHTSKSLKETLISPHSQDPSIASVDAPGSEGMFYGLLLSLSFHNDPHSASRVNTKTNKIYSELYFKQVCLLFDYSTDSHSILDPQELISTQDYYVTIFYKFEHLLWSQYSLKNGLGILIVCLCQIG